MSIKSLLYATAAFGAMMPDENDWQRKIDSCIDEYWKTVNLPRKQKKKERKRINSDYSFYRHMKDWKPFNF